MTATARNKIAIQLVAVIITIIAGLVLWVLINNTIESGYIAVEENNTQNLSHDPNFSKYDSFLFSTEKSEAFNSTAETLGTNISRSTNY